MKKIIIILKIVRGVILGTGRIGQAEVSYLRARELILYETYDIHKNTKMRPSKVYSIDA